MISIRLLLLPSIVVVVHAIKLSNNIELDTCQKFNAPPSTGRVWTLCEGKQFTAPTDEQKLSGVKSSNAMKCTKEMSFEQLCCFDYANVETQLTSEGGMTLDLAQVASTPGNATGTGNTTISFLDDVASAGKNAKQITLCSMKSPTPSGEESAVETNVDCVAHEFSVDEIKSAATKTPESGGNPVLNARIDFLQQQGLPLSAIPLCTETVGATCPCNSKPPSSAGQEFLGERMKDTNVTMMLQKKKFGGALMTSGSFTMMASGGM